MNIAATRNAFELLFDELKDISARLAALEKKVESLERNTPAHLRQVERRFKPTVNGHVAAQHTSH